MQQGPALDRCRSPLRCFAFTLRQDRGHRTGSCEEQSEVEVFVHALPLSITLCVEQGHYVSFSAAADPSDQNRARTFTLLHYVCSSTPNMLMLGRVHADANVGLPVTEVIIVLAVEVRYYFARGRCGTAGVLLHVGTTSLGSSFSTYVGS